MLGRELPCGIWELLNFPIPQPAADEREKLTQRLELGRASADDLYQLGLCHLAAGELGLARRTLSQAIKRQPSCPAARLALAGTYEALAEHYQAAIQIEAVLAGPSGETDEVPRESLLSAAGLAWERSGHWRLAVTRYRDVIAHQPGDPFAHHRLVAIELAHGRLSDAAVHLRSLLNHHPADQTARVCLGHLLQRQRRYAEAAWEYEQALCLEPDSWELPLEAARQLQLSDSSIETIQVLEKLVGAQPHFPDLRMRLANMYSHCGDDEAACAEYQRALSYHPDYLDCHISLARHELRMGRIEESARHFRQAVAINNQHVEVYVGLALALQRSGRAAQAAEIQASAGRIANNSAVLIAQVGSLEFHACEAQDAEDQSKARGSEICAEWVAEQIAKDRMVLAAHPRWNDVKVRLGMLLRLLGRGGEAMAYLRPVVNEEPGYRQAWMQLGLVHADRRAPRKAAAAFASAIDLDPHLLETEYRLSLIYCGSLEFELAMEKLEEQPGGNDIIRRIWVTIDGLRMCPTPAGEQQRETETAGRY
jgi:tetratricopeptide (TPR) repeat protein